jgi:hypothetical protein
MGTYAYVSAAAVLLLALVLWLGPGMREETTQVTLAPGWEGALLESDSNSWELNAGEILVLPPGNYRLTLFATDGAARRRTVHVVGEELSVGVPGN